MGAKGNRFFLLLTLSNLFLTGFSSGELASDRRLLFLFDKIEVRGEVDVFLRQGKRLRECTVYADEEIIQTVKTQVTDRTLLIDANNTYSIGRRLPFLRIDAKRVFPVEVIVSIRDLKEIALFGAGNLSGSGIRSRHLKLFAGGSGKIDLRQFTTKSMEVINDGSGEIVLKGGPIAEIDATINGSGTIYAGDLLVQNAKINLIGEGNAYLSPAEFLDARLLKTGNVFLTRKPEQSTIQASGSGLVRDILPDAEALYDLNATRPKLDSNENR